MLRTRAIRVALLATAVTAALAACSTGAPHRNRAGAPDPISPSTAAATSSSTSSSTSSGVSAAPVVAKPAPTRSIKNPPAAPTETALPRGSTGTVGQVPWSLVGQGWRLVQPGGYTNPESALYLYDPAGGRYLISNELPAGGRLQAWSPDGHRALFEGPVNEQQVDLRSGRIVSGFTRGNRQFMSYTRPNGLAVLMYDFDARQFVRVDADGRIQQRYPGQVGGVGDLMSQARYTSDGSAFLVPTTGPVLLMGNDGNPIRSFTRPAGYDDGWGCTLGMWWTDTSFVEDCQNKQGKTATFIQPVGGGRPTLLTDVQSPTGLGYDVRQRLSNGDTLLAVIPGCGGTAGYAIRTSSGSVRPLRLPAGVPAPGTIIGMNGDVATFRVSTYAGCGGPHPKPITKLIDYNMVTGATSTLLSDDGIITSYGQ